MYKPDQVNVPNCEETNYRYFSKNEIFLPFSPREIWPIISDITSQTRFSNELYKVEWCKNYNTNDPIVGRRFIGYNHSDNFDNWITCSEIIDCIPEKKFSWAIISAEEKSNYESITDPIQTTIWSYSLKELSNGSFLSLSMKITTARILLDDLQEKYKDVDIYNSRIKNLNNSILDNIFQIKHELRNNAHSSQ